MHPPRDLTTPRAAMQPRDLTTPRAAMHPPRDLTPRAAMHPPRDLQAFARDLADLRAALAADIGPADLAHLRRVDLLTRLCAALGWATAWIAPNPLSIVLIAHASTVRWTVLMHHVSHRAYDNIPGVPARYHSRSFAAGPRRLIDWLDWIHPAAWRWEHNALHHPRTGEPGDPDLVQHNTAALRTADLHPILKILAVAGFACTWKLFYYASNTFQLHLRHQRRRPGQPEPPPVDIRYAAAFDPRTHDGRAFWRHCILPHAAVRFVLLPLLFAPLGLWASLSILINSILAELLTNIQTFVLITPNHAGDDLPTFPDRPASRAEFQWRQIAGTVNYTIRGDLTAYLHGWVNYHIEHHLWPDLPIRKYMQAHAPLRALCRKHGVPYRQASVLRRARMAANIMTGAATMHPHADPPASTTATAA